MKPSRFNFVFPHEGQYVVYNTFSKAIALLDDGELAALRAGGEGEGALAEQFRDQGFWVEDSFDELAFLKYYHYKAKFSAEQLSLTIAPTLGCNFACPYCYENARTGVMSEETQDALLSYVEGKLRTGTRSLDITWYGGEPLLCTEVVERMSAAMRELAERYGAALGMSLVTNGYLLTRETVEMFVRNQILSVQITLDGLAENHDQRRYLKNGGGTFDRIFENLSLFRGTPIRVNVRMNVDHRNRRDYPALKQRIDRLENTEIALYPAAVEQLNDRDGARQDYYMTPGEYDQFILDSYSSAALYDGGLTVIDGRRYFCAAELENSYVVDEQGNFYKCWDEIGKPDRVCFHVSDPEAVNPAPLVQYVADDPFGDPVCSACRFLPLCFGGCRFQKHLLGSRACNFTDETLSAFLIAKYLRE